MHPLNKLLRDNRKNPLARYAMAVNAAASSADVYLYDAIVSDEIEAEYWGGVAPQSFVRDLKALDVGTIHLRVNCPGGSVFAARAMEQALREHPARVIAHIDGYAASAGSFIVMAADSIIMAPGALMMIHNGWTFAMGNAVDLRSTADLLDKVDSTLVATYAARTKADPNAIADWMAAETWFTAEEALANGFADAIAETAQPDAQARWNLSAYTRAPALPHDSRPEPSPAPAPKVAKAPVAALLRKLDVAMLTSA
jgi:ATP-dependent Clp protease protease subunit